MTTTVKNITSWEGQRDQDGNRTYLLEFRVESDNTEDGPFTALATIGLPRPGDVWHFGNDNDIWAFCRQETSIKPILKGEPNNQWDLTFTFTTKSDDKRCKDQQIEDPLSIPPRVSGTFQKYQEEATVDRFGVPINNSAWEQLRGAQVEFDKNRPTIKIEMNIPSFVTIALAYSMIDKVNTSPLWGFPPRCIKLSNAPWSVKYYGQCFKYYELSLEFDIRQDTFDRDLLDEGTKVLHGHWGDNGDWVVDNVGGLGIPLKPTGLFTNGAPGTISTNTYFFKITALNIVGETLPGPQLALLVTSPGSNARITLNWPPVPGATNYNVYGSSISGAETLLNPVGTVTVPTFAMNVVGGGGPALPIVDTSGGKPANRSNPQHFDHSKDRNGENIRIILDGAGLPAGVITQEHYIYISIYNGVHKGQALNNPLFWKPIVGQYRPPPNYDQDKLYVEGNLVYSFEPLGVSQFVYLCIQNTTVTGPLAQVPGNLAYWIIVGFVFPGGAGGVGIGQPVNLPAGIIIGGNLNPVANDIGGGPSDSLNNAGIWNEDIEYGRGDYVITTPEAGKIHIEKYNEAEFLLLGVPLVF